MLLSLLWYLLYCSGLEIYVIAFYTKYLCGWCVNATESRGMSIFSLSTTLNCFPPSVFLLVLQYSADRWFHHNSHLWRHSCFWAPPLFHGSFCVPLIVYYISTTIYYFSSSALTSSILSGIKKKSSISLQTLSLIHTEKPDLHIF